jgi:DNA polymerase-3 subunit epsilon
MPRHADGRVDSYLEILESALLDRYLSAHEEDALIETAELGLDRDRLDAVHRDYLLSMAAIAWEDRVVTKAELRDLETVARLLGLSSDDVAMSLDAAKAAASRPVASAFRLKPGDQICLTGQMSHPRETIEGLLVERGLCVGGLTKQTRLLVAADPDSQTARRRRPGVTESPSSPNPPCWASCSGWLTTTRTRPNYAAGARGPRPHYR